MYAMTTEGVFKFLKLPKYKYLNLTVSATTFFQIVDLLENRAKRCILEDGKQQVLIVGSIKMLSTYWVSPLNLYRITILPEHPGRRRQTQVFRRLVQYSKL
jgi:hypothetical protein